MQRAFRTSVMACLLLFCGLAMAQSSDVLGVHDLSTSQVRGASSSACLYCHVPHSGIGKGPLWGQTLSNQNYSLYSSQTSQNTSIQPPLGADSTLCLSCHDGTVALGQTVPNGPIPISGSMTSVLGTSLEGSHPFSLALPLKDASNLVSSLASSGSTSDTTKSVQLIKGNVECTSCHNAHAQRIDKDAPKFLVLDNHRGALCLSCHEIGPRIVNSRTNPLDQWSTSVHANTAAQVSASAGLGGYSTVAEYACLSCHVSHNAAVSSGLLRNPVPPVANADGTSQSCLTCHSATDKLVQPIANVAAEFEKKGHPYANTSNLHSAAEPVVLDQNRHTTCADCHNPHASKQVATFDAPPNIRASQNGVAGVAADGSGLTAPATRQFENCLRCHGNSSGKQALTSVYGYLPARAAFAADPLNLIPQFGATAVSTHPVMRDATLQSQPSLLRYMWDLTGTIQTRAMGTRLFCTDCHNSDDNREFGGTGPNGPHGSNNTHILERRYELSQVAPVVGTTGGPGSSIINLIPNPPLDPNSAGPYSLCAKCHDLRNVVSNASFSQHARHINDGFSCSVCHSAHGSTASGGMSGTRLVNFDMNVVAPNKGVVSYSNGGCTLLCHNHKHR